MRRVPARVRNGLAARFGPIEWVLLATLVVLPTAFIWHFASVGYFLSDDFHNLYWARNTSEMGSFIFGAAYGDHLSPAHRVMYVVLHRVAPMNFEVALGFLLACHAASAVLLQRILTLLFGRAWWTFALALAWAISAANVAGFMWYAAGLHSIPAITATLASIHGYLCWHASRRLGWLALSFVAMGIGLGFYIKALLIPLYLVLMRALLLDPTSRIWDSLRSLLDEWRVWLAYGTGCAAFLLAYLLGDYLQHYDSVSATVGELLRYLRILWIEGLSPMIFGVRVPRNEHDVWHQVVIVAAQGALIALVVWSVVRRRAAWRAWPFLLIAVVANALMTVGRVSQFGPELVAHTPRYYVEPTLLVALAVAFAFATPRVTPGVRAVKSTVPEPRTRRTRQRRPAGRWTGFRGPTAHAGTAALVALAVYASATWTTAESFSKRSGILAAQYGRLAHTYFDNLRAGLGAIRRAGVEPSLLDHHVPGYVVSPFTNLKPAALRAGVRYSLLSSVLPLFQEQVRFNQPGHLYMVRSDGRLQRTRFVPAAGGPPAELRRAGRLHIHEGRIERRRGEWCVIAEGLSVLEWQPRPHLRGRDWWLRVRYRADPAQPLVLHTNSGTGWFDVGAQLPAMGLPRTAIVELSELSEDNSTIIGVRIGVPPLGKLCLRSLEIGHFDPTPPTPDVDSWPLE